MRADADNDALRERWNRRYREAAGARGGETAAGPETAPTPSAVLERHADCLPARGRALDLACGRGDDALWLAARGLDVSAWDLSDVAIAQLCARPGGQHIDAAVRDVLAHPPLPASVDVLVVSHFLERDLAGALQAALRPGGVLFYQTFVKGLSNPAFLLRPNELAGLFPGLHLWRYEEAPDTGQAHIEAMLVARAPELCQ